MGLDLLVGGTVLLFALLGAASGALLQSTRLAAIVAGVVLAKPVSHAIAPAFGSLGLSVRAAAWIGTAVSGVAIYLVFRMGGRAIGRLLAEDREVRAWDRALGGLFGATQALVVIWVLLSAVLLLEHAPPRLRLHLPEGGSFFAVATRDHPFFELALPKREEQERRASPPSRR